MTARAVPLPTGDAIGELLADLLDRACTVDDAAAALRVDAEHAGVVAVFVDAYATVAAVSLADIAFVRRATAALVMLPPAAAHETVAAGAVDDEALDCYGEVQTVLARLLMRRQTPQVKLHALRCAGELVPGPVRALLAEPGGRRDLVVDVEGYGRGHLTVVVR